MSARPIFREGFRGGVFLASMAWAPARWRLATSSRPHPCAGVRTHRRGAGSGPVAAPAGDIGWKEFFPDAELQDLLARALANNRDLRIATLNVEAARAQYRIQRADLVPAIEAQGSVDQCARSGESVANRAK